ncbi:unnamed protein product [Phytophthora lilii]|uniref:Unnamed protein product n=1 Tax=Phytophthora lilii TaxID=2077276 RepID=A0A9W6TWA4_9STRA|nr:unnamed protein product [Phytophthora lilii]
MVCSRSNLTLVTIVAADYELPVSVLLVMSHKRLASRQVYDRLLISICNGEPVAEFVAYDRVWSNLSEDSLVPDRMGAAVAVVSCRSQEKASSTLLKHLNSVFILPPSTQLDKTQRQDNFEIRPSRQHTARQTEDESPNLRPYQAPRMKSTDGTQVPGSGGYAGFEPVPEPRQPSEVPPEADGTNKGPTTQTFGDAPAAHATFTAPAGPLPQTGPVPPVRLRQQHRQGARKMPHRQQHLRLPTQLRCWQA